MISIVILAWNMHEMTQECIESIRETTENYELIFVDNGSDPPIEGATIRNEKNLSFPVAVNQGIRAAKGDVICLLNNDVILTPGWADRLVPRLEKYAIIAPVTNYSAGMQRVTIPPYEDKGSLWLQSAKWTLKHDGQEFDVNWAIGFCFMFRRSLYDEIGEFDESMWPCSGEDIDFCYRARAKGYRVGIARDVYIHHEGSKTLQAMEKEGLLNYAEVCRASDKHLKARWGERFWHEQTVSAAAQEDTLRVNLGCGRFPLKGFVNVDQCEEVEPDLVADATDLPYAPGTVDEIYAGHILEHFDWTDGEEALRYWFGLLKPGGKIAITVPDFDVLAKEYVGNPSPDRLRELNDLYIYSYRQQSPHRYAYSADLLREAMEAAGFTDLKRLPVDHLYFPHPVKWQAGFEGVKR